MKPLTAVLDLPPTQDGPKFDDSPKNSDSIHVEDQRHEPTTSAANPEDSVEGHLNMDQTTEVYTSVETYLHYLNTDMRLGTPTMNEVNLLDRAFGLFEEDAVAAKNLVVAFLNQFLHPVDEVSKPSPQFQHSRPGHKNNNNLSNRKLKKQKYASFQNLYKKSRKADYDSLQNNNSISDTLSNSTVFSFWSHLLTHKSVADPPGDSVNPEVGSFDPNLLMYSKEVQEVRMTKKLSPGLDGLTVFETEAISVRVRAELFSIFLLLSWVPDSILNSYTFFISKKIGHI